MSAEGLDRGRQAAGGTNRRDAIEVREGILVQVDVHEEPERHRLVCDVHGVNVVLAKLQHRLRHRGHVEGHVHAFVLAAGGGREHDRESSAGQPRDVPQQLEHRSIACNLCVHVGDIANKLAREEALDRVRQVRGLGLGLCRQGGRHLRREGSVTFQTHGDGRRRYAAPFGRRRRGRS